MDRQTGYRGYGLAIEEAEPGLSAIAVTVCPQGGAPQGMLAITGPAVRMGDERIAELVEIAAKAPRNWRCCGRCAISRARTFHARRRWRNGVRPYAYARLPPAIGGLLEIVAIDVSPGNDDREEYRAPGNRLEVVRERWRKLAR